MNSERVQYLENKVLECKVAYYNEGKSLVSDFEYDSMEDELRKLHPESKILSMVGVKDGEVDLVYTMFSTDKSLSVPELQTFWNRIPWDAELIASQKVDGMSVSVKYFKGKVVDITTRGDGTFGKSFINKLRYLKCIIPVLAEEFTGFIRGEMHMTDTNFMRLNEILAEEGAEKQENSRNSTSGLINNQNITRPEEKLALLYLRVFGVYDEDTGASIVGSYDLYTQQLEKAKSFGYTPVDYRKITKEDITEEMATEWIKSYDYGNDGLVIRVNDNRVVLELGTNTNSKYLKGVTAFKLKPEMALAKVLGYEWSYGSNEITPVLLIEPTFVDGATISRVNGHSVKNLVDLDARIGSTIALIRSGSVIPKAMHRSAINQ